MPIDNLTFLKHQPPPEQPRPRPWWVAPLVFILGAAALITAAAFAWGDDARTRVVVVICIAVAAVFALWRLRKGWDEGGLLGVFYRDRQPMGSILAGDEERDGLAISLWLLSGLALILAVSLWANTPGAFAMKPPAPPGGVTPVSKP